MSNKDVFIKKLEKVIKDEMVPDLVAVIMEEFDQQVLTRDDPEDPMSLYTCREEFKLFLEETVEVSFETTDDEIKFEIGDKNRLGMEDMLDENTTDCLRIIGTVFNGISGRYVLVTLDMYEKMFPISTDKDIGRTGLAYLMERATYDRGVVKYGWQPKQDWGFSNTPPIDVFQDAVEKINFNRYIEMAL